MPGKSSRYRQMKEGPIVDHHPLSRAGLKLGEKWRRKGYLVRYRHNGQMVRG